MESTLAAEKIGYACLHDVQPQVTLRCGRDINASLVSAYSLRNTAPFPIAVSDSIISPWARRSFGMGPVWRRSVLGAERERYIARTWSWTCLSSGMKSAHELIFLFYYY